MEKRRCRVMSATMGVACGVTAAILGGLAPGTAKAQITHDVHGASITWAPDKVHATLGDEVTWHYDDHNVWLVPPGGDLDPAAGDIFRVGEDYRGPASYTLDQLGTWTFVCRFHSGFSPVRDAWVGMFGTIEVGAAGGIPRLELSVNPRSRVVGPRAKEVRFVVRVANLGDGPSGTVALLARAPMRRFTIRGGQYTSLAAGDTTTERFRLMLQPAARGTRTQVKFTASGPVSSEKATAMVRVRRTATRLKVEARPERIAVDPRTKQMNYLVRATNTSRRPSGVVRLCARRWPHRHVKLLGERCEAVANVRSGASAEQEFSFRVLDRARGKLSKIRFRARGPHVEPAATTVSLRVRRWASPAKTVAVSKYEYSPRAVTVRRGDRVVWKGERGSHTVTFSGYMSPFGWERFNERVLEGDRLLRTARRRGSFRYYCLYHGSMRGKVIVR
jgi:plastocyanin